MSHRPYPSPDRALRQLGRHPQPAPPIDTFARWRQVEAFLDHLDSVRPRPTRRAKLIEAVAGPFRAARTWLDSPRYAGVVLKGSVAAVVVIVADFALGRLR